MREGQRVNRTKGRIQMLGVDPDCRGRGIGKRALVAGLAYLENKGVVFCGINGCFRAFEVGPSGSSLKRDKDLRTKGRRLEE